MITALVRTAVLSFGRLVRIHEIEIVAIIPVMMPYPVRHSEMGTGLVAALGCQVQAHVCADQLFVPPAVSRIGMENVAGHVLVEHTYAGYFLVFDLLHFVVAVGLALRDFLFRERYVIIVVEVAAARRHPMNAPAHPLLEGLDLG